MLLQRLVEYRSDFGKVLQRLIVLAQVVRTRSVAGTEQKTVTTQALGIIIVNHFRHGRVTDPPGH
mgnify:CR=1 FL=1